MRLLRHLPVIKCPALLPRITYCADKSTNKGWTFYFLDLPKRWLNKNHKNKYGYAVALLGDDLYSHQPICELAVKQGYNFIFVCLETSHKTLYEWLEFLERSGEVTIIEKKQ